MHDNQQPQTWRDTQLKEFEDSFAEGVTEAETEEGESVEAVFEPLIAKYLAIAQELSAARRTPLT
ncbi:hypothetical protein [Mitsuaria sp. 7]|uniref:hypothetical protein n=1 Tax=Mitsuaria sp. 7 TaxID=1658665 RepID=UPI0007DDD4DB|nr:hypothetical protein [Mitsuaria sp. 7]ANH69983.1 hypothetical protein ABE85_24700 [Mitsuaria sp. 7]